MRIAQCSSWSRTDWEAWLISVVRLGNGNDKEVGVGDMTETRYAIVRSSDLLAIQEYMPRNYTAVLLENGTVLVSGKDSAGWTLDGYVIPRLGSGLHGARELVPKPF